MIRIKLLESSIKLLSVTIFLPIFFILYSSFVSSIFAADSSPSAQPTASTSASLINKLNTLKAEIASKASQIKLEVNKKIENKVFAGVVETVKEGQITLATKNGERTISVDKFSIFSSDLKSSKKNFKFEDIVNGDFLISLGDVDDKGNLVAKKVIKSNKTQDQSSTIWGQIQSITGNNYILKDKDGQKLTINTNSKTLFSSKTQEISLKDLELNNFLVIKGAQNFKEILAKFIYLIDNDNLNP